MSEAISLLRNYQCEIPLPALSNGMVIAIVLDAGPGRPCGQSMSTTCSWQYLHIFRTEAAFREAMERKQLGRGGRNEQIAYQVIGDYGTGHMHLVIHEGETK